MPNLPPVLSPARLRLPVVSAPMFIVSQPALVIAQCKAGVVGSFPALNARPPELLDEWLHQIREELAAWDKAHPEAPSAPFAVNQIVHKSNDRLQRDVEACVKHKVPIVITSLGAREDLNQAIHSYGGVVLHDVIHVVHARKALEKGADGPTVLFEAGIAATNLNWFHIQETVSEFACTASYDRCGLGWSSPCRTARTPGALIRRSP